MTNLVLNGKAICCMHKGDFDEAETLLLEALNRVGYNILACFFTLHMQLLQDLLKSSVHACVLLPPSHKIIYTFLFRPSHYKFHTPIMENPL